MPAVCFSRAYASPRLCRGPEDAPGRAGQNERIPARRRLFQGRNRAVLRQRPLLDSLPQKATGFGWRLWRLTRTKRPGKPDAGPFCASFIPNCPSKAAKPPRKRQFLMQGREAFRRHPLWLSIKLKKPCAKIAFQGRCFLAAARLSAGESKKPSLQASGEAGGK